MDEVVEALEKYQGLVPLVYDIETMSLDEARPEDMRTAVYLKREADKVIAEKDSEIARLNAIRKVHVEAIESMGAGLLQDDKEIRHQKYKRCLAMAKWCDAKADWYYSICESFRDRVEFYIKWRKRWLKLAEKFKPNN